jgi:hypothetical protein
MAIETDYLVVGAGASGMAFADALVTRSDAHVLLVDRRHRPGGHWSDDYQFVRLHQPSAYYGVDSVELGSDRIDTTGPNAGFYERATGAEMCEYYDRVLAERLVPTGRVRFLGMTDYVGEGSGDHTLVSLLTGQTTSVRVRRRLVDASYIATTIPSMHKPSFSIEPGARVITPNDLVRLGDPGARFTVIGAGKTAMDTCCWLIDQGVDPASIRWIRPRDPYVIDRSWTQPLSHIAAFAEWLALQYEAAAVASDRQDFIRRLEESRVIRMLDPNAEASVYRGATMSEREYATLSLIEDVVRKGRVLHVGTERVQLDGGDIPARVQEVFVDCTAAGLGIPPARTIFEQGRITIQRVQAGIDPFSAALIGVIEATERDDEEKNRLCPPNPFRGEVLHLANQFSVSWRAQSLWFAESDVRDWFTSTRLNPFSGLATNMSEAAKASMGRMISNMQPALENLQRIVTAEPE